MRGCRAGASLAEELEEVVAGLPTSIGTMNCREGNLLLDPRGNIDPFKLQVH